MICCRPCPDAERRERVVAHCPIRSSNQSVRVPVAVNRGPSWRVGASTRQHRSYIPLTFSTPGRAPSSTQTIPFSLSLRISYLARTAETMTSSSGSGDRPGRCHLRRPHMQHEVRSQYPGIFLRAGTREDHCRRCLVHASQDCRQNTIAAFSSTACPYPLHVWIIRGATASMASILSMKAASGRASLDVVRSIRVRPLGLVAQEVGGGGYETVGVFLRRCWHHVGSTGKVSLRVLLLDPCPRNPWVLRHILSEGCSLPRLLHRHPPEPPIEVLLRPGGDVLRRQTDRIIDPAPSAAIGIRLEPRRARSLIVQVDREDIVVLRSDVVRPDRSFCP